MRSRAHKKGNVKAPPKVSVPRKVVDKPNQGAAKARAWLRFFEAASIVRVAKLAVDPPGALCGKPTGRFAPPGDVSDYARMSGPARL